MCRAAPLITTSAGRTNKLERPTPSTPEVPETPGQLALHEVLLWQDPRQRFLLCDSTPAAAGFDRRVTES